ncbi:MAG: hypothetical protein KDB69_06290 [Acidimicrobiia bacterium]|nr:hypothetical protein [Acidimicrobiia bacterium]
MLPGDRVAIVTSAGFGATAGWFVAGLGGTVIGAVVGATFAWVAARARVRPWVVTTMAAGAAAGVLIGVSIVETICLPGSCVPLEVTGGIIVGLASLVGVGLVAALVTRSFDEYNEAIADERQPPAPGCESGED